MNLVLVDMPKPRTFVTGDLYRHHARSRSYDVSVSDREVPEWHDPAFVAAMWEWVDQRFPGCDCISLGVSIMLIEVPKKSWPSNSGSHDTGRKFLFDIDVPMGVKGVDIWSVEWEVLRAVSAQATLDVIAKRLELAGAVPQVPLTQAQLAWIEEHGRPDIKVSMGKWKHFDWREHVDAPVGDPDAFDPWQLFPGGQGRLSEAKRRWRKLPKARRLDAQAAVARLIDDYFDAGGAECVSDGGAMEAGALLLLGKDAWERALADPGNAPYLIADLGGDESEGELLLDLINWWEM